MENAQAYSARVAKHLKRDVIAASWSPAYELINPVALAVKRANAALRHNAAVARTSLAPATTQSAAPWSVRPGTAP